MKKHYSVFGMVRCGRHAVRLQPGRTGVLITGDSLTSDIQGGVDYGIDACWYNPTGEARPENLQITYEIRHLRELLDFLVSQ